VGRTVLVDHHAFQRLAGTLLAVLALVALVEVLDVPALVAPLVERLKANHFVDRRLAVRHLLDPPVDQSVQPGLLVAVDMAPKRPLTHSQQLRRLLLGEPLVLPARIGFFEPHHPDLL
jgi:hypothetical protein